MMSIGKLAKQFEHQGRAGQAGEIALVKRRRHLHQVGTNQVQPGKLAETMLRLQGGHTANFRRSGAGGIDRIQHVDIKADVGGLVADNLPRPLHHPLDAQFIDLLHTDNRDAVFLRPAVFIRGEQRAANTDLHRPSRVENPLFHGAAKRGAVGKALTAKIAVVGVRMGIKMDHAQRLIPSQRPQNRQGGEMVAPRG